ncbi:helix-turn-helix domain-containing protein [Streptomyces sp. NBC_01136]|uniref:helix-turn-helix domain-containing protein n=1 Tax=unclassified Streptomyces TaxID=2593676 RepID=UPI00324ACFD3|nr:helix-turn-helix domain-containing protein [Streptomyces sp. NBC_01136]
MEEPEESKDPQERQVRTLDARALRRRGPATASMLAERLGESSGATSYHLRQLAAHGFVEDAPERGKGRERWWQSVDQGLYFDENLLKDPDPAVRGAADTFLHEIATTHTRELSTWLGTRDDWSEEWYRASDMSDWTLRLTAGQTRELTGKMHALLLSYRPLAPAEDDPEAERVRFHMHAFPIEQDRTETQR